jgi:predicted Zn-dependent protease with MMP-like domain
MCFPREPVGFAPTAMNFEGDPNAPFSHLLKLASQEIEQIRSELPDPLRDALNGVATVLEEFPSLEHEADGVDGDQLGLFEGADAADPSNPQMPRIVLWLGNLWDMCGAEEDSYREEVRITFLHELGHYLGLDEGDLFQRGLE